MVLYMMPYINSWQYLPQVFLEWEIFQITFAVKIKTFIFMFSNFSPQKSCRLWDNVEKHVTARQSTEVNIIQRMCIACWMTKATDTNSEYIIFPALPRQQWLRERVSVLHLYVPVSRLSGGTIVFTSPRRSSYAPWWQYPNLDTTGSFHIILHSLLDASSWKFFLQILTKACRYITLRFVLKPNKKNRHFIRSPKVHLWHLAMINFCNW